MTYRITALLPKDTPIVLASASPRRREILSAMGLSFAVRPCDVDETLPRGLHPREGVVLLAERKAHAAADRIRTEAGETGGTASEIPADTVIIASDTLVETDGEALGKPTDEADARAMLARLSGKEHRVHTGVAVLRRGRLLSAVDTTRVFMRTYSDEEIAAYIATGEPSDKAGAYAIQGLGGALVARTEGEFDTVVGLPSRLLDGLLCALIAEETV